MNRGFLESSPVQQMMISAGNPNWWSITNSVKPPPLLHPQLQPNPSLLPQYPPLNFLENDHNHQELPESWCQLLMGESPIVEEGDERSGLSSQYKKLGNWEEQILYPSEASDNNNNSIFDHVKQEVSDQSAAYVYGLVSNGKFQTSNGRAVPNWSPHHQVMPVSSPSSCVTSFSSNSMLDFSTTKSDNTHGTKHHSQPDHSSECNSTETGGAFKKARVQQSSTQSTFKVRKEKLGDRITALHQLVSPFGKTDTASVLLEAIGYIRFLQNQIE
ncbi:hypothetical protein MKX01_001094, partial [Papaver californicum]